jgi:hypothetical protein
MTKLMCGKNTLLCVLSGLLLGQTTRAVVAAAQANPYEPIVARNVFGLKPPPPPPRTEAPPPPVATIKLTGITTILGNKLVLMKVSVPAKPPEPAKELSLTLTEGQREGDIEVLAINEKTGDVKVSNGGVELMLNIDKDSPKLPGSPVPAAPGMAGNPNVATPMAGVGIQPGATGNPTTTLGAFKPNIPTRSVRVPNATGAVPAPVYTVPTPSVTPQRNPPLSREEQFILMEVERERARQAVQNGQLPPLPPNELTPQPAPRSPTPIRPQ